MLYINEECSICLDILRENYILTECNHHFHKECINLIVNNKCPLCRNVFRLFNNDFKASVPYFEYIESSNDEIFYDGINYPLNFVINNLLNTNYKWDWKQLSLKIPIFFIENNKLYPWDWNILTDRMTIEFITNHQVYNWDWYKLSDRIPLHILEKMLYKKYDYWNWDKLSMNVSIEFIISNKFIKWNWDIVTKNKIIDFKNIQKYKNIFDKINWNIITKYLLENNINFIKNNPNFNWNIIDIIQYLPEDKKSNSIGINSINQQSNSIGTITIDNQRKSNCIIS